MKEDSPSVIPTRFAVGDYVRAHYEGRYELGIVTQLHYSHPLVFGGEVLPYQVRLLGTNTLICARVDQDSMVRRAAPPVDTPPRFRYGDRVQVKFAGDGTWTDAWITQLLYTQPADSLTRPYTRRAEDTGEIIIMAPYQVRLATHTAAGNLLHFVPIDDDSMIRRVVQEPPRPALRFVVGTGVECFTDGGWAPGRVVRQWYTHVETDLRKKLTEYRPELPEGQRIVLCAPYQIALENGRLIYAPYDDDGTIRPLSQPPPLEASLQSAPPAPPADTTLPLPPRPPQPPATSMADQAAADPAATSGAAADLPSGRSPAGSSQPPRRRLLRGDELRQEVARRSGPTVANELRQEVARRLDGCKDERR